MIRGIYFVILTSLSVLWPTFTLTFSYYEIGEIDLREEKQVKEQKLEEGQGWFKCDEGRTLSEQQFSPVLNAAIKKDPNEILQRALKKVEPKSPIVDRRKAIQVEVITELLIDDKGKVIAARIIKGHPLFNLAVLHALCQWEFEPFYHEGKPVSAIGNVVNVFKYDKTRRQRRHLAPSR